MRGNVEATSWTCAGVYLFEEMEAQTSFTVDKTVDSAVYDDYVGRYDYGNSLVLTVTKENGRLLAQLTGQGALEIFPRAKDEFFWKEVDAQITFTRDGPDHVTGGIHRQGGQTLNVLKLKEEAVAQIDPAVYDAYVGDYKLENVGIMEVVREDAHLGVQVGGQPRTEVFPRTATEFFLRASNTMTIYGKAAVSCHSRAGGNPGTPRLSWTPACAGVTEGDGAFILLEALKIVQASITFTKDADGKVVSLTLKQSDLTLTGLKVK